MRYQVLISLNKEEIPKDKNRMILSFMKHYFEESDESFFESLYVEGGTKRKDFTFSLYMEHCEFLRDTIRIPSKRIFLNFSTYDLLTGIQFYNAMIRGWKKEYVYKDVGMKIQRIELKRETTFREDKAVFKALSPCVVREHNKETNRDWFHSLNSEEGRKIFVENLKYQLLDSIPEARYDADQIDISLIKNKEVKVKHYGIEVLSNLCTFEMKAKPYILDYFYKAGAGSLKSTGFSMLSSI